MNRILLISFEPNEAFFLSENLKENGYEIIKLPDVRSALELIKEAVPALAVINILDDNEPVELLTQLEVSSIKRIIIGSSLFAKDTSTNLTIRPLRPKRLLSMIRGLMEQESSSAFDKVI